MFEQWDYLLLSELSLHSLTPWSVGCNSAVTLGGKNCTRCCKIFCARWVWALSINKTAFSSSPWSLFLIKGTNKFKCQYLKRLESAFEVTFLRAWSIADFPVTNSGNFKFLDKSDFTCSLLDLRPLADESRFEASVILDNVLKNKPVLSTLKIRDGTKFSSLINLRNLILNSFLQPDDQKDFHF